MSDSDLQITITADASGVGQGTAQAKAAIAGLNSALSGLNVSGVVRGADQIKSSLGGVRPSIDGFAKSFDGVADRIKGAFSGVSSALVGLKSAGQAGGSSLAALAQVGGGAATAIAAVGGVALGAASAVGEWVDRTKDSATASAGARQNAAALSAAMAAAGDAFGQVGDTVASAFAPVMTALVAGLTSMAQAFEASYNGGGLAKTALDLLAASANQLVGAISAVVSWWKLESDAATGFGQAGSNAFTLLTQLARDLQSVLASVLSPAFATLRQTASGAWGVIRSSFEAVLEAVKTGYADWRQLNQPLVVAVNAIGAAFEGVESRAVAACRNIADWLGKLTQSLVRFLEKLPGVGDAFQAVQTSVSHSLLGLQTDFGRLGGSLAAAASASPPAQPAPAPKPLSPPAAAAHGGDAGGSPLASGGDPATVQEANGQVQASNAKTTTTYVAGQQQQQAAAQTVEAAKTAASDRSTAHIVANDRKLLEALKSSVDSMVSTFNRGLLQMAERTRSFAQVMRSMAQQLLNDMLRVVDEIVEKWVWGETEKLLASTAGQALLQALGLKDLAAQILIETRKTQAVVSGAAVQTAAKTTASAAGIGPQIVSAMQAVKADAAQVFGNVFAWMTSNPVTAPAAPAAAAAASAAVMAVPFAIGTNFVPADTLAYVHQGERILPKADNTALMSALGALQGVTNIAPTTYRPPTQALAAASAAGDGGPWGGSGAGATTHNTLVYSPQVTPQKDFRKDLQDHASDVFALLQRGVRDGVLKV